MHLKKSLLGVSYKMDVTSALHHRIHSACFMRDTGSRTERDVLVRAVQMVYMSFFGTGLQTDGLPE